MMLVVFPLECREEAGRQSFFSVLQNIVDDEKAYT